MVTPGPSRWNEVLGSGFRAERDARVLARSAAWSCGRKREEGTTGVRAPVCSHLIHKGPLEPQSGVPLDAALLASLSPPPPQLIKMLNTHIGRLSSSEAPTPATPRDTPPRHGLG